jgi:hypothetical protein
MITPIKEIDFDSVFSDKLRRAGLAEHSTCVMLGTITLPNGENRYSIAVYGKPCSTASIGDRLIIGSVDRNQWHHSNGLNPILWLTDSGKETDIAIGWFKTSAGIINNTPITSSADSKLMDLCTLGSVSNSCTIRIVGGRLSAITLKQPPIEVPETIKPKSCGPCYRDGGVPEWYYAYDRLRKGFLYEQSARVENYAHCEEARDADSWCHAGL